MSLPGWPGKTPHAGPPRFRDPLFFAVFFPRCFNFPSPALIAPGSSRLAAFNPYNQDYDRLDCLPLFRNRSPRSSPSAKTGRKRAAKIEPRS